MALSYLTTVIPSFAIAVMVYHEVEPGSFVHLNWRNAHSASDAVVLIIMAAADGHYISCQLPIVRIFRPISIVQ